MHPGARPRGAGAAVAYRARLSFAMDRLRKAGKDLVYRCAKQHSEPGNDKRGARVDELILTPLELIVRIAALVSPPHTHRHRYFGALTPNSPMRAAVTAMATPAQPATAQSESSGTGLGTPAPRLSGNAVTPTPDPVPPKRPAHYFWAVLIARIYEVFPLLCPLCGGQIRLIAFITHSAGIRQILEHIGADSEPPHIAPARGPPLWDDCDAQDAGEKVEAFPDWDWALRLRMPWSFQSRRNFDRTDQAGDQRQFGPPVTGHLRRSATGPNLHSTPGPTSAAVNSPPRSCRSNGGFSLQTVVWVKAHDRKRLEQLCRYISRSALSDEGVQLNSGHVELKPPPSPSARSRTRASLSSPGRRRPKNQKIRATAG